MTTDRSPSRLRPLLISAAVAASVQAGATDISSTPLPTYEAPSSTDVKPNILFVLDDSGSMDWDFMPDWACASASTTNSSCNNTGQNPSSARNVYWFKNAGYNGIYYNPAVVYKAPAAVDSSGATNTTTYPSQTGMTAATGADASTKPNWKAVMRDAYGVQSTTTSDLTSTAPTFYTFVPGEFCKNSSLNPSDCVVATTNPDTNTYKYNATMRWCNSSALTTCKATFDASNGYTYARAPAPRTATITISGNTATGVSGITVDGLQIMAASAAASSTSSTVATNIAAQINACTSGITGNCTTVGFSASSSGSVVTITAPSSTGATPVVSPTGSGTLMSFSATAFAGNGVPGENLRTVITPDVASYPYPGTAAKAASRTDCAGTTCTYAEEMTNYANWWTYYRTRMQMMKTVASNTFSAIDTADDIANGVSRYRLGYLSINDNTNSDFLNLGEFSGTHKSDWFSKIVNASPSSSTPLRVKLATAGRLYGGKLNGTTLNGTTVTDPLQYSCQRNYTILSTDGFWNESETPAKLDGSTAIGNRDGVLVRPYFDGASTTTQSRTSRLQTRTITDQPQISTSTLQRRAPLAPPSILKQTSRDGGSSWTSWSAASSCTVDSSGNTRTNCKFPASTSSDYGATWTNWFYLSINTQCVPHLTGQNQTACSAGTWTNATSCTAGSNVQCQYTAWTAYSNTGSCTPVAQSAGPTYTVGTAVQCRIQQVYGTWTNAATCTVSSTTDCGYTQWTSWADVSTCTEVAQSTGPSYDVPTAVQCQTAASGGTGTSNTLADVAAYYYLTDLRDPNATGADATGTCTGPIISPATTANDLCTNNVKPVEGTDDQATTQHMTTFTLGLGAQGKMVFSKSYKADASSTAPETLAARDYYDVYHGTPASPTTGICSWQTSGACNWPTPSSNSNANIDDLWHAAVNGRGSYFSATDPKSLEEGLVGILTAITNTPRPGTAAAAASSNPNVSTNDNLVFSSSYKSVDWYGELVRQEINPTTGVLTAQNWSAMRTVDCATTVWAANRAYVIGDVYRQGGACYVVTKGYTSGTTFDGSATGTDGANIVVVHENETATSLVDLAAPTSRTIYTTNSTALIPFAWASLSTAQQAYFTTPAISGLSQFCTVGANCVSDTAAASGQTLVEFLAGDRSHEGTYFRRRVHVLGDIVSSEARYVAAPMYNYADANYASFKTLRSSRAKTVFVAANDGMLHAFDAANGKERWAYIPSFVLPNLYALADINYANPGMHRFFVDGTPETGDICPSAPAAECADTGWRTILVGGLNRGGKGYYALDITDPTNPAFLWEFTDTTMGYSYGNPRITKLRDGTWVVLLTSGYNNSDGIGRLYVVNASTGIPITPISTGVAAGLGRISAHAINSMTDNTTTAAYGGDLQGNLWRFDINNDIGAAGFDAQKLVQFVDASGNPQPITAKPLEATINGKPVVYVGTGKYLGTTDIADTQLQSFYAVQDNLDSTTYGNPRVTANGFVEQTLTQGTCPDTAPASVCSPGQVVRTTSSNTVSWGTQHGWYMDFLTGGERDYTDPVLGLGTLMFTTIRPQASSASACGDSTSASASFAYMLNYRTGAAVANTFNVAAVSLGAGLATRPTLLEGDDGTVRALIRTSGDGNNNGTDLGSTKQLTPKVDPSDIVGARRVSWRELPK